MENKVLFQNQKAEAIKRMETLGICSAIIDDFRQNNNVQYFETALGIGYWLNEDMKKAVREFQERTGALVYCAIKSILNFYGDVQEHWTFLFVSKHEEEWSDDNQELKDLYPCAYVYNASAPDMSEAGYVGVAKTVAGGLRRTA